MLPKRVLQAAMDEISRRFSCSLAGYDPNGECIVCAGDDVKDLPPETIRRFAQAKAQSEKHGGATLVKICAHSEPVMVVAVSTDKDGISLAGITEMVFGLLLLHQKSRFGAEDFYRHLFDGVLSPAEAEGYISELELDACCRVVYFVSFGESGGVALADRLRTSLQKQLRDTVMIYRQHYLAVIHEVADDEDQETAAREELEQTITEAAASVTELRPWIGCGCRAWTATEICRSFEEAVAAIRTGRIFDPEAPVHRYRDLRIEQVARQLPKSFSRWFVNQNFRDGFFDQADDEMVKTGIIFLDNNMNVAATCEQLHIHRNTLRYRLDSIQQMSGLDLRDFEDAMVFRLGWAIRRCIEAGEVIDSGEIL